jgi:hypothetical protein
MNAATSRAVPITRAMNTERNAMTPPSYAVGDVVAVYRRTGRLATPFPKGTAASRPVQAAGAR